MDPVKIIGVGMSPQDLTDRYLKLIDQADILVGGRRLLDFFKDSTAQKQAIGKNIDEVSNFVKKKMKKQNKNTKVWLVDVSMGYGHQRTAYPLKDLAFQNKVINANDYPGIPEKDRKVWERSRKFYEFISKFKRAPLIGDLAFAIFDKFQEIALFYPKRDLSKPTIGLKQTYALIKKGWGQDLIQKIKKEPLPFVTTFFIPAFMYGFTPAFTH